LNRNNNSCKRDLFLKGSLNCWVVNVNWVRYLDW
jgi:hypothetical protein